ncbi:hypothetical protein TNCV_1801261 [Trichonephila clavipes]|nr:hypothetical protein TNCV_1801261 [Trichonephila clavipes]
MNFSNQSRPGLIRAERTQMDVFKELRVAPGVNYMLWQRFQANGNVCRWLGSGHPPPGYNAELKPLCANSCQKKL